MFSKTLALGPHQTTNSSSRLEVKLKIREPVGGAQCEFIDMRWLIIGKSGQAPKNPPPSLAAPRAQGRRGGGASPNPRRR